MLRFLLGFVIVSIWASAANASEVPKDWPADAKNDEERAKWLQLPASSKVPEYHSETTMFSLTGDITRKRNFFWPALVSIPLPGFGQWWEGQYLAGGVYSGLGAASLIYGLAHVPDGKQDHESDEDFANRGLHGVKERKFQLGFQTYQSLGGLSAYHYFRTAVRSRQPHGEFLFLHQEETIGEILLAPFRFEFVLRPTTYAPLLIGAAAYWLIADVAPRASDEIEEDSLSGSDVFFASAFSYNAGTHEEAIFRGWLMPMFMYGTESEFWSNSVTALIFAAAHLGSNPLPLPQLGLGWYMGWVTQKNNWTIAEAVFIHTWWDVLAFMALYQIKQVDPDAAVKPALHLPPLEFRF